MYKQRFQLILLYWKQLIIILRFWTLHESFDKCFQVCLNLTPCLGTRCEWCIHEGVLNKEILILTWKWESKTIILPIKLWVLLLSLITIFMGWWVNRKKHVYLSFVCKALLFSPGEEDADEVNWMLVHEGEKKSCQCGHWFQLFFPPGAKGGH